MLPLPIENIAELNNFRLWHLLTKPLLFANGDEIFLQSLRSKKPKKFCLPKTIEKENHVNIRFVNRPWKQSTDSLESSKNPKSFSYRVFAFSIRVCSKKFCFGYYFSYFLPKRFKHQKLIYIARLFENGKRNKFSILKLYNFPIQNSFKTFLAINA